MIESETTGRCREPCEETCKCTWFFDRWETERALARTCSSDKCFYETDFVMFRQTFFLVGLPCQITLLEKPRTHWQFRKEKLTDPSNERTTLDKISTNDKKKTRFSLGWKCPLAWAENVPSLELKMSLALGWKCPSGQFQRWKCPCRDKFSAENVPVGTNSALKMSPNWTISALKMSRNFPAKKKSDILRTFSALILSGRGTFSAEKWDIFSLLGWKCPQIIVIIIIIIIIINTKNYWK